MSGDTRPSWPAIWRGMRRQCPRCGARSLFAGYTRIAGTCGTCGLAFSGHRADDAPPYITMLIVGHLLIVPIVEVKRLLDPPLGLQMLVWMGLALTMSLWLLPKAKGGLIGLQWAQRMHGFGDGEKDGADVPDPKA